MIADETDDLGLIPTLAGVARLEFLILPVVLVSTGYAAAAYSGETSLLRTAIGLSGLILLHLAVNILNEVSDYRSGIDEETEETPFSGGSKTLQQSSISVTVVERVGQATGLAGVGIGVYFVLLIGWYLLPLLALGVLIAFTYTDYLTHYGLGEMGMALGLGALPIVGTDLLQDGAIGRASLLVALPAAMVAFNLLLLNEFPDVEADRTGGRRNLIHRLGRTRAARLYAAVGLFTPVSVLIVYAVGSMHPIFLLSALPSVLLYRPIRWALERPEDDPPTTAMRDNLLWNIVTTAAMGVTLGLGLLVL